MLSKQKSWPMFHYDLAHTGYSTNTGPSSNQTLWVFKTNGNVWSSPAVVNGVVYFGSFDKNCLCLNAKDGSSKSGVLRLVVLFILLPR